MISSSFPTAPDEGAVGGSSEEPRNSNIAWGDTKLLYEGKLQFVASLGSNKEQKKKKRQIQLKMWLIPTDSSVTILVVIGINQKIRM